MHGGALPLVLNDRGWKQSTGLCHRNQPSLEGPVLHWVSLKTGQLWQAVTSEVHLCERLAQVRCPIIIIIIIIIIILLVHKNAA